MNDPGLLQLQHLPQGAGSAAEAAGILQLQEAYKVSQEHVSADVCLLLLLCHLTTWFAFLMLSCRGIVHEEFMVFY